VRGRSGPNQRPQTHFSVFPVRPDMKSTGIYGTALVNPCKTPRSGFVRRRQMETLGGSNTACCMCMCAVVGQQAQPAAGHQIRRFVPLCRLCTYLSSYTTTTTTTTSRDCRFHPRTQSDTMATAVAIDVTQTPKLRIWRMSGRLSLSHPLCNPVHPTHLRVGLAKTSRA
jgi:hypothetical protein